MSSEFVPGLVSIVIPCYKGERWLPEAIESCLTQTHSPIEIIVVDDASPDSCAAIAERYAEVDARVRVLRRPQNGGVSRAFNAGFEIARGEFFTRLAQDDRFEPDAAARMVAQLRAAGPRTGLAYCGYGVLDETSRQSKIIQPPPPALALRYRNEIGLCVMWTRQVWETIGGFDPAFDAAEDFEYWLRVFERFSLVKCDGPPALWFRQHSGMGSVVFGDRQCTGTQRAIIANARRGRFKFDRRWPQRRIALCRVYQMIGYEHVDHGRYGKALGFALRSYLAWPLPIPKYARDGGSRWRRMRMVATLLWRLVRVCFSSLGSSQEAVVPTSEHRS